MTKMFDNLVLESMKYIVATIRRKKDWLDHVMHRSDSRWTVGLMKWQGGHETLIKDRQRTRQRVGKK